jgi:Uma2 family endonuclease
MNINLIEQSGTSETEEQRLILYGVNWQQYETLQATLNDFPGLRMFYLEGTLEIMSPSPEQEVDKTTIARLIEIYALERDIDLTGYGSTTFRKPAQERGLEPDECYCFGQLKEFPDIALEVIVSSGGIDKLSIY